MSHVDIAIQRMQGGDFNGAIELLSKAEASFQTCNLLGIAHQMNRDWVGARRAWEEALTFKLEAMDVLLNLGIACVAMGDKLAAEKHWLRILRVDSSHVQSLINLGLLYREEELNEKAHDCWERALDSQPDLPNVIEWLADVKGVVGYVHLENGDIERAGTLLHDAVGMDDSHPMLWGYLAELYLQKQETEAGIAAGRKAIELEPNNLDFYQTMVKLYRAQGNEVDALGMLKKAEEMTIAQQKKREEPRKGGS